MYRAAPTNQDLDSFGTGKRQSLHSNLNLKWSPKPAKCPVKTRCQHRTEISVSISGLRAQPAVLHGRSIGMTMYQCLYTYDRWRLPFVTEVPCGSPRREA